MSFYRGYLAYMAAILFWMSILPIATDFLMTRMPLLGNNPSRNQPESFSPYYDDEDEDED